MPYGTHCRPVRRPLLLPLLMMTFPKRSTLLRLSVPGLPKDLTRRRKLTPSMELFSKMFPCSHTLLSTDLWVARYGGHAINAGNFQDPSLSCIQVTALHIAQVEPSSRLIHPVKGSKSGSQLFGLLDRTLLAFPRNNKDTMIALFSAGLLYRDPTTNNVYQAFSCDVPEQDTPDCGRS